MSWEDLSKFIGSPGGWLVIAAMIPFFILYGVKFFKWLKKQHVKRLKFGNNEVDFGNGNSSVVKDELCKECELSVIQALPILLAELRLKDHMVLRREYRIESCETMRKQMTVVETAMGRVATVITKNFLKIAEKFMEATAEDVRDSHVDYVFFMQSLKIICMSVTDKIRGWFRENKLDSFEDVNIFMKDYCEPKVDLLMKMAIEDFNNVCHGITISRADLYENDKEVFAEVKRLACEAIVQARQIKIDDLKEIQALEKEYREFSDRLLLEFLKKYTYMGETGVKEIISTLRDVGLKK